jgi:hypothetical protein
VAVSNPYEGYTEEQNTQQQQHLLLQQAQKTNVISPESLMEEVLNETGHTLYEGDDEGEDPDEPMQVGLEAAIASISHGDQEDFHRSLIGTLQPVPPPYQQQVPHPPSQPVNKPLNFAKAAAQPRRVVGNTTDGPRFEPACKQPLVFDCSYNKVGVIKGDERYSNLPIEAMYKFGEGLFCYKQKKQYNDGVKPPINFYSLVLSKSYICSKTGGEKKFTFEVAGKYVEPFKTAFNRAVSDGRN